MDPNLVRFAIITAKVSIEVLQEKKQTDKLIFHDLHKCCEDILKLGEIDSLDKAGEALIIYEKAFLKIVNAIETKTKFNDLEQQCLNNIQIMCGALMIAQQFHAKEN